MICQGSPEKEPIGYIQMYTGRDLLQELAHEIMKSKKSLDLLSTTDATQQQQQQQQLENRKASGVIQSSSEGLSTKRADNVNSSPNPKALEPTKLILEHRRRQISQLKQRGNLPFLCFFILFRPSKDWMMSACIGEGNLFFFFF